MFARIKRVGAYAYLQLVRTERCGGAPRQRVLATLGRVEHLQRSGELDGLLRSLSQYSPQALALVCGQTPPATRTWKVGPVLVFERLWQRLGLGEILQGLLAGRQFGFAVERAIFVTVLHRLAFLGATDRPSGGGRATGCRARRVWPCTTGIGRWGGWASR